MIDLDHSKHIEDQVRVKEHSIEGLDAAEQLRITSECDIDAEVARKALRAVGTGLALTYVRDVLESHRGLLPVRRQGEYYGTRDLDWLYDVRAHFCLDLQFLFLDEPKATHISGT